MTRQTFFVTVAISAMGFASCSGSDATTTPHEAAFFEVRGLGPIQAEVRSSGPGNARSSWTTFTAQDPVHAAMIGSKFLTDASWGPVQSVKNSRLPGTVLALDGSGWWALGMHGNRFEVIFGRTQEEVRKWASQAGASSWQPITTGAYPQWLDFFDKAAVGFWVNGGGVLEKDLPKSLQWVADRQFTVLFADTTETRLVAPAVLDDSTLEWEQAMANKYGFPYRTLDSWVNPQRPQWIWNRIPLPHVVPIDGFHPYGDFDHQKFASYNVFEPILASDAYQSDLTRRIEGRKGQFDHFIGHHGSPELGCLGLTELQNGGDSPGVVDLWRQYLRDTLGLSLEDVGRLHRGSAQAYASWDEVSLPLPQKLYGWNDAAFDLRGIWEGAPDSGDVGTAQKWYENGSTPTWSPISCNDPMIMLYLKNPYVPAPHPTYWLRRKVVLGPDQAKQLQYLHISRARWHFYPYNDAASYMDVYCNGQLLKNITGMEPLRADDDLCFPLGSALKPGENSLVINTKGMAVPSYIFLSPAGRWEYPSADPLQNRIFYDMLNFEAWLRSRHIEDTLKAIRSDEPLRPVKLMAPSEPDMIMDLCQRYGAYPHDTGQDGAVWAPWLARYATSRGLMTSSEPAGPPTKAADVQQLVTFYLMLGNSAVDFVFSPEEYRTPPDISQWIDDHLDLMHCIGKMNMVLPPSVGVLRSSRTIRLKFAEPWLWDLGRGELQAIGRTFNYADDSDVTSGRIDREFKILIDDGTTVMTKDEVAGLERYVRQGGTFVALHNTGMHTPEQAMSWPISELTGLKVVAGGGESGNLVFREDETLWPQLQGQRLPGSGIVLDWMKQNADGSPLNLQAEDEGVHVMAEWDNRTDQQGRIAVAYRNLGKGRVITLGSPFWRSAHDASGRFQADDGTEIYLDQLLDSLGAPRESWRTGGDATRDVFVEQWRSKNGIFDLFPTARINESAQQPLTLDVSWRRAAPIASLREISAAGSPARAVQWQDGRMTLANLTLGPMESRVFAAPRPDIEKSALYWLETEQTQWPILDPIPEAEKPPLQPAVADVLPLKEDWTLTTGDTWADRPASPPADGGKKVKLGTFAVLGLPESTLAHFRKSVSLPPAWSGQRVFLRFDAESWVWGIRPKGRLWVGDRPVPFSVTGGPVSAFSVEVTDDVHDQTLDLALEVDGRVNVEADRAGRPSGVTGAFYLQAEPRPVSTQALSWKGGTGVEATQAPGTPASYLESRFVLPPTWPAPRLFVETSNRQLGWLMLNDHVIQGPAWMQSLDVSGLIRREGENILRWIPSTTAEEIRPPSLAKTFVPSSSDLKLVWRP